MGLGLKSIFTDDKNYIDDVGGSETILGEIILVGEAVQTYT